MLRFVLVMAAATIAALIRLFGTGTAPHENHCHRQHHQQRKKLLPIHNANIAANLSRANGILRTTAALPKLVEKTAWRSNRKPTNQLETTYPLSFPKGGEGRGEVA